mmetsp:Transcript_9831/g.22936  ORF Transcript_9831/g.22936 Transcript_9831/m.22936 type:complete len:443 (+) Transcript_9831:990-2318(+)
MPAHPVDHPPRGERHHGSNLLSEVGLDELAEVVDAERVHKVLHAGVCAHLAVAVVALRGQDGLHELGEVLLGDVSKRLRHPGKGALFVVCAAHAPADEDIVALEGLAVVRHDDDEADVVDEEIDRVVAGDRHRNLELAGEVLAAVEGFLRIPGDDAIARVVKHCVAHLGVQILDRLCDGGDDGGGGGALHHVLLPVLDSSRLLAVHPKLGKSGGGGGEEVSNVVASLKGVLVGGVREGGGGGHDVAVDVAAPAEGRTPRIGDGGNDALEVRLLHTVDLPRLTGSRPDVVLPPLCGDVVDGLVHLGRQLAVGDLEAQHKLVASGVPCLVGALEVAVLLHVGPVVLEDDDRVVGDADGLAVGHLLLQGVAEVGRVLLGVLGLVLCHVQVVVRLVRPGLPGCLGSDLLPRRHPRRGGERVVGGLGGGGDHRWCDPAAPGTVVRAR